MDFNEFYQTQIQLLGSLTPICQNQTLFWFVCFPPTDPGSRWAAGPRGRAAAGQRPGLPSEAGPGVAVGVQFGSGAEGKGRAVSEPSWEAERASRGEEGSKRGSRQREGLLELTVSGFSWCHVHRHSSSSPKEEEQRPAGSDGWPCGIHRPPRSRSDSLGLLDRFHVWVETLETQRGGRGRARTWRNLRKTGRI